MSLHQKPYIITVEGNIAAGKSSFLKYISDRLDQLIKCFPEPVHKWSNYNGNNLLDQMYQEPNKKSFQMQVFIQHTVAEVQLQTCNTKIKMTERSLLSERYVFTNMIRNKGFISSTEFDVLDYGFQSLNQLIMPANEIIYLRTSPHIAMSRLLSRNRLEERNVSLDYLTDLHKLHDQWLLEKDFGTLNDVLITVIDQDQALIQLYPEYDKIIKRLLLTVN